MDGLLIDGLSRPQGPAGGPNDVAQPPAALKERAPGGSPRARLVGYRTPD